MNNHKMAQPNWTVIDDSLYISPKPHEPPKRKIAAFDFDDTLVKRENNELMFPGTKGMLHMLHNLGYTLVIFTNESLDSKPPNERCLTEANLKLTRKLERLETFRTSMGVPIFIYMATKRDKWRKWRGNRNSCEMWKRMESDMGAVDMTSSFFCGDAGGRPGDFSDCDLAFAQAAGVQFHHASEFIGQ